MAFQKEQSDIISWIKRIISWSVFLIPITYVAKSTLYPFISFKTLMFYFFVEIVFFLWLYALLVKREVSFRLNIVSGAFLLFILAIILSAIFGKDPSLSFWSNYERMNGVLTWLHIGGLFVVATSVFRTKKDWMHLFWVNSIAAAITAAVALFGRDGLGIMEISEKGGSLIGNTSFIGSYLLISFFMTAYLWIREYKNRGVLSVLLLLSLVSPIFFGAKIWSGQLPFGEIFSDPVVFLGRARAATISLYFGLGSLVLGGIFVNSKKKLLKTISKIGLWIAVVAAVSTVVMFFISGSPVRDFVDQETSKSRSGAWSIAVEGWKQNPVFGVGIGNFSHIYQEFYNPLFLTKEYGAESWMDQAHSVGYEILATLGSFGYLSFALLYMSSMWFLWSMYRKEEIDLWEALIPTALIFAHLIQNLTVFDTITTFQMFALMFAFIAANKGRDIDFSASFWPQGVGQTIALGGLIASMVFFVFIPYSSARATLEFSRGEFISSEQEIEKLFARVERSNIGEMEKTKLLSELWRGQIAQFPQIISRYGDNVVFVQDKFLETMIASLEKHPGDSRTAVTIARMAVFQANMIPEKKDYYLDLAEEYALQAREVNPNHQMGYWTLALVRDAKGDREGAYELAKEAHDLAPEARGAEQNLMLYK